jgi:hypothetical protein
LLVSALWQRADQPMQHCRPRADEPGDAAGLGEDAGIADRVTAGAVGERAALQPHCGGRLRPGRDDVGLGHGTRSCVLRAGAHNGQEAENDGRKSGIR